MAGQQLVECSFLIPLRRDKGISDGKRHRRAAWDWLNRELFARFSGATRAPGTYLGSWRHLETGEQVTD